MSVAINEELSIGLSNLQPLWHDKAPRKLVESCPAGDPIAGWKTWQRYLEKRRKPKLPRFLAKKLPAILWAWPRAWERDAIRAAIESPASLAEIVIGDDIASAPDLSTSLQMVALAYALPKLATELPAETWWFLAERLHAIATDALSQRIDATTPANDVLRIQLLAGELPLTLAYLFPELSAFHALRTEARAMFSESLVELTDGQGLPTARLLPMFGPLFACWTCARSIGKRMKEGAWSRPADVQFEWLVRNAIRLASTDGKFLLAGPANAVADPADNVALFQTALDLAGDRSDHAAALRALPTGTVTTRRKIRPKDRPHPSLNSDWSSVTIMSNGWAQDDARLAISYTEKSPLVELSVDGELLLAGEWTVRTTCDGKSVEPTGEWEQLCWESGKQYDYLELGLPLTGGMRIERQILFGRTDRVLYIADLVLAAEGAPGKLQHSVTLPFATGAEWKPEADTRDGVISHGKVTAAVMPLALQERRADPRGGSLTAADGGLTLSQQANGHALCCPLFIDLKRSAKERTWRQLTVGDALEIVPADVAVGYRIQSGDEQWLIYRSLGKPGNRTLLGHNVAGEFCAGRFVEGKFKEWIELEAV